MTKEVICYDQSTGRYRPYSQAITYNGVVYTSGQLPIDMRTGAFRPLYRNRPRPPLKM